MATLIVAISKIKSGWVKVRTGAYQNLSFTARFRPASEANRLLSLFTNFSHLLQGANKTSHAVQTEQGPLTERISGGHPRIIRYPSGNTNGPVTDC